MRRIALVLLCALLSGCFTYAPTQVTPRQAARVRVTLSSPADFRLRDFTANEVVAVEGEMVRADSEQLVLSAMDLRARSGYEFIGQGETLTIPRSNVTSVETRRVSPWRSALILGALVAVMTVMEQIIDIGGEGDGGNNGGGPIIT